MLSSSVFGGRLFFTHIAAMQVQYPFLSTASGSGSSASSIQNFPCEVGPFETGSMSQMSRRYHIGPDQQLHSTIRNSGEHSSAVGTVLVLALRESFCLSTGCTYVFEEGVRLRVVVIKRPVGADSEKRVGEIGKEAVLPSGSILETGSMP